MGKNETNNIDYECQICDLHLVDSFYHIKLNCGHIICEKCLIEQALQLDFYFQLEKISQLECQICSKQVGEEVFTRNLSKKQIQQIQQQQQDKIQFTCEICYLQVPQTQGIKLSCNCTFCQSCLFDFTNFLILNAKVSQDQLCCPLHKSPIFIEQIQHILENSIVDKYYKFMLEQYQQEQNQDKVLQCKQCNCFVLQENTECFQQMKSFKCYGCKQDFCPHCQENPHLDLTCEQYRVEKLVSEADLQFMEFAKQQGFMKCPYCALPSFLVSGCKFLTCTTKFCKSRNYFCYLCGDPLKSDQHFNHWVRDDPFGKECKTQEREKNYFEQIIPYHWFDKTISVELRFQERKENQFKTYIEEKKQEVQQQPVQQQQQIRPPVPQRQRAPVQQIQQHEQDFNLRGLFGEEEFEEIAPVQQQQQNNNQRVRNPEQIAPIQQQEQNFNLRALFGEEDFEEEQNNQQIQIAPQQQEDNWNFNLRALFGEEDFEERAPVQQIQQQDEDFNLIHLFGEIDFQEDQNIQQINNQIYPQQLDEQDQNEFPYYWFDEQQDEDDFGPLNDLFQEEEELYIGPLDILFNEEYQQIQNYNEFQQMNVQIEEQLIQENGPNIWQNHKKLNLFFDNYQIDELY